MQPAIEITNDNRPEETSSAQAWEGMPYPLLLDLSCLELTDDQIEQISIANSNLQLELTAKGQLVIMPPTRFPGFQSENDLACQVTHWAKEDGTGIASGPSGGFRLPNGALYAPDASWTLRVRMEEWLSRQNEALATVERGGYPALCPDFVLELRSEGDTLVRVQRKMQEYLENGARLGWLVDPINRRVYIYRPGEAEVALDEPETVSGDPVLPGFVLHLQDIW